MIVPVQVHTAHTGCVQGAAGVVGMALPVVIKRALLTNVVGVVAVDTVVTAAVVMPGSVGVDDDTVLDDEDGEDEAVLVVVVVDDDVEVVTNTDELVVVVVLVVVDCADTKAAKYECMYVAAAMRDSCGACMTNCVTRGGANTAAVLDKFLLSLAL